MTASLVIYLLKWSLCLTLFYSLFRLCLRSETLHRLNRAVLLTILVASMVLPLCRLRTARPTITSAGIQHAEAVITSQFRQPVPVMSLPMRPQTQASTPFPWLRLTVYIYIIGVVVFFGVYVYSLLGLLLTLRAGRRVQMNGVPSGVRLICCEQVQSPCSWMHWILVHPKDMQMPIIRHELSHIRHGHSWDMLLSEFTARMLWFLPFAWMLRQDLADVHEYEADRDVLRSGINEDEYQHLLIAKATRAWLRPVVNALTQSSVKKRFMMMCRRPSHRASAIKALYLLPCAGMALTAFARPAWVEDVRNQLQAEDSDSPPALPDREGAECIRQDERMQSSKVTAPSLLDSPPEDPDSPPALPDREGAECIRQDERMQSSKVTASSLSGRAGGESGRAGGESSSSSSPLVGTWLKYVYDSSGDIVHVHQKTILSNGIYYVQCAHAGGEHTISSGTWELVDDHHYVEHIEHITTDPSSQGMDNVITYSFAADQQQLYLSYVMPGNGVSGSEYWQRTE